VRISLRSSVKLSSNPHAADNSPSTKIIPPAFEMGRSCSSIWGSPANKKGFVLKG
jgi:hypothetical protein